jgi:hypothetical protein
MIINAYQHNNGRMSLDIMWFKGRTSASFLQKEESVAFVTYAYEDEIGVSSDVLMSGISQGVP